MGCTQTKRVQLVEKYAHQGHDLYFKDPLRARRRPYVYELARFAGDVPESYTAAVIDRLVALIRETQRQRGQEKSARSNRPKKKFVYG